MASVRSLREGPLSQAALGCIMSQPLSPPLTILMTFSSLPTSTTFKRRQSDWGILQTSANSFVGFLWILAQRCPKNTNSFCVCLQSHPHKAKKLSSSQDLFFSVFAVSHKRLPGLIQRKNLLTPHHQATKEYPGIWSSSKSSTAFKN